MTDALGLSVGAVNLVAVRPGQAPVLRRAVLTLSDRRPPEVGVPQENPNLTGTGLVVGGFVERVGDPAPVAAADGSTYRGEELAADALDALARSTGYGAPVCIAVPAHWGPGPSEALRVAVRSRPGLKPGGTPAVLVPDAAAAITALHVEPGLPREGVVALCDFGGSGTSITLVDAAANYRPIAPTVRYGAFSGDQIDDAILNHLLARLPDNSATGLAGTAAVGSLTRLRDDCRAAKERLSASAATAIPVDLPGFDSEVELTRDELENIVAAPLAGAIDAIANTLTRNRIPAANLAAVAAIGGGASIPMVGTQLSERLRVPLVTASRPGCAAATGAALLAQRQPALDALAGSGAATDAPTSMATAAWAATAAGESAADGDQSATFRALAWSQDDSKASEPVPYAGADYSFATLPADTDTPDSRDDTDYPAEPGPLAWYKRPVVLFGLAAALALAATGGLAYTLTGEGKRTGNTAPAQPSGEPQPPAAPSTVTITAPNGSTSLSTIPPPPPSDTATESTSSTATEPTTTTQPTTTQPTTTTRPTTSSAPPSTTQPPSSSTAAPSTTAAPPTTAAPTGGG